MADIGTNKGTLPFLMKSNLGVKMEGYNLDADAIIIAVAHKEFENMAVSNLNLLYGRRDKVLLDIKGILDKMECEKNIYRYCRL